MRVAGRRGRHEGGFASAGAWSSQAAPQAAAERAAGPVSKREESLF
jgi:hypothetical protein